MWILKKCISDHLEIISYSNLAQIGHSILLGIVKKQKRTLNISILKILFAKFKTKVTACLQMYAASTWGVMRIIY